MITLDGSLGEGGGQILRTALSLSVITGQPFTIENIRARRKSPGLKRQHLAAVQAAAEICGAQAEGAEIDSMRLSFVPGTLRGGEYTVRIGTAGSCTLALQTVLPALLKAQEPSTLYLEGGTHNPLAPPADFLQKTFLPVLARLGAAADLSFEQYGFYPAGGGRMICRIQPWREAKPLTLLSRGELREVRVRALVALIPPSIGWRETEEAKKALKNIAVQGSVEEIKKSHGPGNIVLVEVESAEITEVCTGFGMRGVRAETVARQAAKAAGEYLASGAPVGEYLADQLLLPLAVGAGGSFHTLPLSQHSLTNLTVIRSFLPTLGIRVNQQKDDTVIVEIQP